MNEATKLDSSESRTHEQSKAIKDEINEILDKIESNPNRMELAAYLAEIITILTRDPEGKNSMPEGDDRNELIDKLVKVLRRANLPEEVINTHINSVKNSHLLWNKPPAKS